MRAVETNHTDEEVYPSKGLGGGGESREEAILTVEEPGLHAR